MAQQNEEVKGKPLSEEVTEQPQEQQPPPTDPPAGEPAKPAKLKSIDIGASVVNALIGYRQKGEQFNPALFAYSLGKNVHDGDAEFMPFDEARLVQQIKEKTGLTEEAQVRPIIDMAKTVGEMASDEEEWKKFYFGGLTIGQIVGTKPYSPGEEYRQVINDPYHHIVNGKEVPIDTPTKLGAATQSFFDRYGTEHAFSDVPGMRKYLLEGDMDEMSDEDRRKYVFGTTDDGSFSKMQESEAARMAGRRRYGVEFLPKVNAEGDVIMTPVVKERNLDQFTSHANDDLYSPGFGAQTKKDTWLGSGMLVVGRGLEESKNAVGALLSGGVYRGLTEARYKVLVNAQRELGLPIKDVNAAQFMATGDLWPIDPKVLSLSDAGKQVESKMWDAIGRISANEDAYREAAKEGNPMARAAVDLLDAYRVEIDGGTVDRAVGDIMRSADMVGRVSQRGEKHWADNPEAAIGGLSQVLTSLIPQAGVARGGGALLLAGGKAWAKKYGASALIKVSAKAGMKPVLSKGAQQGVGFVANGMVPAIQVFPAAYNSARKAGYDKDTSLGIGLWAGVMAGGASYALSNAYMMRGLVAGGGQKGLMDTLYHALSKEAPPPSGLAGKAQARLMNAVGIKQFKAAMDFFKRYQTKGKVGQVALNFAEGYAREGTEEAFEEAMNYLAERATDNFSGKHLYEKNSPEALDFFGRLWDSFALGGLGGGTMSAVLGGKHNPHENDGPASITRAVVEGDGDKLLKMANELLAKKVINEKEHGAILQDINLTEHIINKLKVVDSDYINEILGNKDLTLEYTSILKAVSKRVEAIKDAEAVQKADESTPEQKTEATSTIAEMSKANELAQKRIDDILSGREAMARIVDVALMKSAADKSDVRAMRGGSYLGIANAISSFTEKRKEVAKERREGRAKIIDKLHERLDKLQESGSSDLGGALTALESLAEFIGELRGNGHASKEDFRALREGAKTLIARTEEEMLDLPTKTEDGVDTTYRALEEDSVRSGSSAGDRIREAIDNSLANIATKPEAADKALLQLNEGKKRAQSVLALTGGTDQEAEALLANLDDNAYFTGEESDDAAIKEAINSLVVGKSGLSLPLQSLVDYFRGIGVPTEQDRGNLKDVIMQLSLRIAFLNTSAMGVNDALMGLKEYKGDPPPAFATAEGLRQDVVNPSVGLGKGQVDELQRVKDELVRIGNAMGLAVDMRTGRMKELSERMFVRERRILKIFRDATKDTSKELGDLEEALDNELAKDVRDHAVLYGLVAKVRAIVSKRLMAIKDDAELQGVFFDMIQYLKNEGLSGGDPYESSWLVRGDYDEYTSEEAWTTDTHADAMVGVLSNWFTMLSSVDHVALLKEVAGVYGLTEKDSGFVPNTEQSEQILFLAALMANPTSDVYEAVQINDGVKVLPRGLTLPGKQGVGKTTTIGYALKVAVALRQKERAERARAAGAVAIPIAPKIVVIAASEKNKETLAGNINAVLPSAKVSVLSMTELDKLGDDVDFVFIDEAHAMPVNRLTQYRTWVEGPNNKAVSVMIGDPNQAPPDPSHPVTLPARMGTLAALPVTTSFRTGNTELLNLNAKLEAALLTKVTGGGKVELSLSPSKVEGDNAHGVLYVHGTEESVYTEWARDYVLHKDAPARLIVLDGHQKAKAIEYLLNILGQHAPAREALGDMVSTLTLGKDSILGGQVSRAFVALTETSIGDSYLRYLYTAIGRAENFVAFPYAGVSVGVNQVDRLDDDTKVNSAIWSQSRKAVKDMLAGVPDGGDILFRDGVDESEDDIDEDAGDEEEIDVNGEEENVDINGQSDGDGVDQNERKDDDVNTENEPDEEIDKDGVDPNSEVSTNGQTPEEVERQKFMDELEADSKKAAKRKKPAKKTTKKAAKKAVDEAQRKADQAAAEKAAKKKEEEAAAASKLQGPTPTGPPPGTNKPPAPPKPGSVVLSGASFSYRSDDASKRNVQNPAWAYFVKLLDAVGSYGSLFTYEVRMYKRTKQGGLNTGGVVYEIHAVPNDEATAESLHFEFKDAGLTPEQKTYIGVLVTRNLSDQGQEVFDRFRNAHEQSGFEDGLVVWKSSNPPVVNDVYPREQGNDGMALSTPMHIFLTDSASKGIGIEGLRLTGESDESKIQFEVKFAGHTSTITRGVSFPLLTSDEVSSWKLLPDIQRAGQVAAILMHNKDRWRALGWKKEDDPSNFPDGLTTGWQNKNGLGGKLLKLYDKLNEKDDKALFRQQLRYAPVRGRGGVVDPESVRSLTFGAGLIDFQRISLDIDAGVYVSGGQASSASSKGSNQTPPPDGQNRRKSGRRKVRNDDGTYDKSRAKVIEYMRRVLGDRFIANQLSFKSGLKSLDGRDLYGLMERARIILDERDGNIHLGTDRHETLHYVMDHLLTEESAAEIIEEARALFAAQEGMDPRMVSDEDAHEFLARRYEDERFDKRTAFGRFMSWLKAVLSRWGLYRERVDDLLWRIEYGHFRDAPIIRDDAVRRHSEKGPGEAARDGGDIESTADDDGLSGPSGFNLSVSGRVLLDNIFSGSWTDGVLDDISQAIMFSGPWAAPAYGHERLPLNSVPKAVQYALNCHKVRAEANPNPVTDLGSGPVDLLTISPDDMLVVKEEDGLLFIDHKMADPGPEGDYPLFTAAIKAIFPKQDVASWIADPDKREGVAAEATDMDMVDQQEGHNFQDADTVFPFNNIGGVLRFLLEYSPLLTWNSVAGKLEQSLQNPSRDTYIKLLATVCQGIEVNGAKIDGVNSAIDEIGSRLWAIMQSEKTENGYEFSEEGRHAATLYHVFFGQGDYLHWQGWTSYSYKTMARTDDEIIAGVVDPTERQNMIDRKRMADQIVRNLASWAVSLSPTNYGTVIVREMAPDQDASGHLIPSQPSIRTEVQRFLGGEQIYYELQDATLRLYDVPESGPIGFVSDYREGWVVDGDKVSGDPNRPQFFINEKGIGLVGQSKNPDARLADFDFKEDHFVIRIRTTDESVVNQFFLNAGVRLHPRTITRLMRDARKTEGAKRINFEDPTRLLQRIIGQWAAATWMSIQQIEKGVPMSELEKTPLYKMWKKHGGTVLVSRSELSGENTLGTISGKDFPAIIGSVIDNKKLAALDGKISGANYSRAYKDPTGNMVQADPIGDLLKRKFPNYSDGDASRNLRNLYHKGREWAMEAGFMAHLNGKFTWLNPLMDPDPDHKTVIEYLYFNRGIRTEDFSQGQTILGQNDFDLHFGMFAGFVRKVMTQGKRQSLEIPLRMMADRGGYPSVVMNEFGDTNKFFQMENVYTNGKKTLTLKSVAIDYKGLDRVILRTFQRHREIRNQSFRRWFDAVHGDVSTVKGIKARLAQLAGQGVDVKAMLRQSRLKENVDYIISGDEIRLGNAFTGAGMFTPERADQLEKMDLADRIKVYHEIFSQEGLALRGELNLMRGLSEDPQRRLGSLVLDKFAPAEAEEVFLEGYVLASSLVQSWVDDVTTGPAQLFKNLADQIKRGAITTASGRIGMFQDGPTARAVIFNEPEPTPEEITERLKQGLTSKPPDPFDGQAFGTPVGWLLAQEAYGGGQGPWTSSVNKRVYASPDMDMKYSEATPVHQWYLMNRVMREFIDRSFLMDHHDAVLAGVEHDVLYNHWMAQDKSTSEGYWNAAQSVIDLARQLGCAHLLNHIITSKNNVKKGLNSINELVGSEPLSSVPMDIDSWLLQGQLDRNLEDLRVSVPAQLFAFVSMGENNVEVAERIDRELQAIQDDFMRGVDKQVGNIAGVDNPMDALRAARDVQAYLRKVALTVQNDDGKIDKVTDALLDETTSMNDPILAQRVIMAAMTRLRGKALWPKMYGQLFTQVSGWGLEWDEAVMDKGGRMVTRKQSLRPPRKVNGVFVPGEVMMPFLHAKRFGFPDGTWEHLTLEQIRTSIASRLDELGPNALADFEKTLDVMLSRMPGSGPQSAMPMRIVEFINGGNNVVYVPAGLNERTGGDQDGDQLSAYMRNISKNLSRKDIAANNLLEALMDYYKDPGNIELIMAETTTAPLEALYNALPLEMRDKYGKAFFSAAGMVRAGKSVKDGKEAIAQVASTMKINALLRQAWDRMTPKERRAAFGGHRIGEAQPDVMSVMALMSVLLNSSLDNIKKTLLGPLGFTPVTMPLALGLAVQGKNLQEIVAVMMDPRIQLAANQMLIPMTQPRQRAKSFRERLADAGMAGLTSALDLHDEYFRMKTVLDFSVKGGTPISPEALEDWSSKVDLLFKRRNPAELDRLAEIANISRSGTVKESVLNPKMDMKLILSKLGSFDSAVMAVQKHVDMLREYSLMYSAAFTQMREQGSLDTRVGLVGESKGAKKFNTAVQRKLIGLYIGDQYGHKPITLVSGLPPIDLSTMEGQYRFRQEFPVFYKDVIDQIPIEDRLANNFLSHALVMGAVDKRVGVLDGQRLSDPTLNRRVRRDVMRVDDLVQKVDDVEGRSGMKFTEILAIYSMLNDQFSWGKQSLFPLLPSGLTKGYGQYLDRMAIGIRMAGKVKLGDRHVDAREFTEILANDILTTTPSLLLQYTPKGKKLKYVGDGRGNTVVSDQKKSDTHSALFPEWTTGLGSKESPSSVILDADGTVRTFPRLRQKDGLGLLMGEDVVLAGRGVVGWQVNDTVHLPNGIIATVTEVHGKDSVVVTPTNAPEGYAELDNESTSAVPALLPFEDSSGGVHGGGRYGDGHSDLDGVDLTSALERLAERCVPQLRGIVKAMLEEQRKSGRKARVIVSDNPGGNGRRFAGFIDGRGNIYIKRSLTANRLEEVLLHEAGHRFTSAAFAKPASRRSPEEQAYVDGIRQARRLVRSLWKDPDKEMSHYLSSDAEFATTIWTSRAFQENVASLQDGEMSLWQRIVSLVRRMFGMNTGARNAIVSNMMDLTRTYVRYASVSGDTRFRLGSDALNPADLLASGEIDYGPQAYGYAQVDFGPIKDVRDIITRASTSPKLPNPLSFYENEDVVRRLKREIMSMKKLKRTYGGREFFFGSERGDFLSETEVEKIVREEIAPLVGSYTNRKKTRIVEVLNQGEGYSGWAEAFSFRGQALDTIGDYEKFISSIGHQEGDIYVRYSDLKNPNAYVSNKVHGRISLADLNIPYIQGFEGDDPIIRIRNRDGRQVVGIIEISPDRLARQPILQKGVALFANYGMGTSRTVALRGTLGNNAGDARVFMLGTLAMALKKASPGIEIDKMKVVHMGLSGFDEKSVWMPSILREVKNLMSIPALAKELPSAISSVLRDQKLQDTLNYGEDVIQHFNALLESVDANLEHASSIDLMDALGKWRSSDWGSRRHLNAAIIYRMKVVESELGGADPEMDEEYQLLSKLLYAVGNADVRGANTINDLSIIWKFLTNPMDVPNDLFQWVRRTTNRSIRQVVQAVEKDQDEHKSWFEKKPSLAGKGRAVEFVVGGGHARFEHLFRWSSVEGPGQVIYDLAGNRVRARLNILHWDRKDPETAALIASGDLVDADLEYTNKVLDHIHGLLVDLVVHEMKQNMQAVDENGSFNEAKARAAAEAKVSRQWKRGWVPVLNSGVGEAILEGRFKEGFERMKQSVRNVDSVFEEDLNDKNDKDRFRVADRYMSELEDSGSSDVGGDTRLGRLGLREDGSGRLTLMDAQRNAAISGNMETIFNYFSLAAHRKMIHESQTVPVVNAALTRMTEMKLAGEGDTKNIRELLLDYSRRLVYNENNEDESPSAFGRGTKTFLQLQMRLTSAAAVGWSIPVGIMSTIFNESGYISTAVANDAADNGLYGKKEARKAQTECSVPGTKGHAKAKALAALYQVSESQEHEIVNNEKNLVTKGKLFGSNSMQVFNRKGDNHIRMVVLAAQMMKDGTWDAYSISEDGELVYDQKKDGRFYDEHGVKRNGADQLIRKLKEEVREDGVVEQTEDGPLLRAYDHRSAAAIKTIADKYVIGAMDASERVMLNAYIVGRLFLQFKQFLPARVTNWLGTGHSSDALGHWETIDGMTVWEKREIQSSLGALIKSFKLLNDARTMGLKDSFGNGRWNKADGFATQRLANDIVIATLFMVLALGLKDDDKERRRRQKLGQVDIFSSTRVLRMLRGGALDVFAGSPIGLLQIFGQPRSMVPSLNNAWRGVSAVFTDPTDLIKLAPGAGTFKFINDITK